MDVVCPRSTARVPPVAVDVVGATATCVRCDERFALPERLGRDRALVVRQWPRPWRAQARIDVGLLRELLVVRREARSHPLRVPTTYTLCAEVAGGSVELATGFTSADEARYVAQVIEEHLGIGDDPGER